MPVMVERRYGAAFVTSLAAHAGMLGIALLAIRAASDRPRDLPASMAAAARPGSRKAELRGADRATVRAGRAHEVDNQCRCS